MWILLSAVALAGFGQARLVSGTPEFESCLAGSSCASDFYAFLSESMLEQGFTMQGGPGLLLQPHTHSRRGWVAGGALSTFPFGPPQQNLSGKEENTDFSPVFGRLVLGHIGGGEEHPWALGASLLPPVPVNGATALELGLEGALSRDGQGLEADFTFVRARAPITASEEQFEDRESFSNPDNLDPDTYAARCSGDGGCIDTYTLANTSLRASKAWGAGPLRPYARAGLNIALERLEVQYDGTEWGLFALQPVVGGGMVWSPGEHAILALGSSLALRQPNQDDEGHIGLFYRLEGSAGWAF